MPPPLVRAETTPAIPESVSAEQTSLESEATEVSSDEPEQLPNDTHTTPALESITPQETTPTESPTVDSPQPESMTPSTPVAPKVKTAPAAAPSAIKVTHEPRDDPPLPPQRDVYVTAFQAANGLEFIELYNSDSIAQSIDEWRMIVVLGDDSECEITLSGYILPETKVLLAQQSAIETLNLQFAQSFSCGTKESVAVQIQLFDGDQLVERIIPTTDEAAWNRVNTTKTYLTGLFSKDFELISKKDYRITDGAWYQLPDAPPLQIIEVLVNPRDCLPSEASDPSCYDFIKMKNTSSTPVDLSQYRLRSGFVNSNSSSSNTFYFYETIPPGETRTMTHSRDGTRLSFTANDGTVWFEDAEGVTAYKSNVSPYIDSDLTANVGRSWAYDAENETWRWAVPAPTSTSNNFSLPKEEVRSTKTGEGLKPCRSDQYRSPETNRCRLISSASPSLTPCRSDQYRSPETNRCRLLSSSSSSLTPCKANQYRNPETNRCRLIASTASSLKPCKEGQERNPDTNRCRMVTQSAPPASDFPVEEVADTATAFAGWWALGGIGLLAAGYGAWEWRAELRRGIQKGISFVTRSGR